MNTGKYFYACFLLTGLIFTFPLKADKHLFCYKYRIYDQMTYQTEGRDSMIFELSGSDQLQNRHFFREETYRVQGMSAPAPYLFQVYTDTMWSYSNEELRMAEDEKKLLSPVPVADKRVVSMNVNGRPVHKDSLFQWTVFSIPLPEFPIQEYDEWKFQIHQDDGCGQLYTGETCIAGNGQLVACQKEEDGALAVFLMNVTMISTGIFHPRNILLRFERECETTGTYLVYFDEDAGRVLKVVADLDIIERRLTQDSSIKFRGNIKSTTRLVDPMAFTSGPLSR